MFGDVGPADDLQNAGLEPQQVDVVGGVLALSEADEFGRDVPDAAVVRYLERGQPQLAGIPPGQQAAHAA